MLGQNGSDFARIGPVAWAEEVIVKVRSSTWIQKTLIFIMGNIDRFAVFMVEMDSPTSSMQAIATMPTVMVKLRQRSFRRIAKDYDNFNIWRGAFHCFQRTDGPHVVRTFIESKFPGFISRSHESIMVDIILNLMCLKIHPVMLYILKLSQSRTLLATINNAIFR
jgi:hypothetical protein